MVIDFEQFGLDAWEENCNFAAVDSLMLEFIRTREILINYPRQCALLYIQMKEENAARRRRSIKILKEEEMKP